MYDQLMRLWDTVTNTAMDRHVSLFDAFPGYTICVQDRGIRTQVTVDAQSLSSIAEAVYTTDTKTVHRLVVRTSTQSELVLPAWAIRRLQIALTNHEIRLTPPEY